MTRVFGTKEWAKHNLNCCTGCSNGCRYCYARYDAVVRFKRVMDEEWKEERVKPGILEKGYGKRDGVTMFPTQHDITPGNIDACLIVLKKLLAPGNKVLIVSKPNLECTKRLCDELAEWKENILFRFTIGASNDNILSYWEPKAPKYAERLASLKYACAQRYATSVSMEPVLDWENVVGNFEALAPYVTNSIWIGALNFISRRVEVVTVKDLAMVDVLKEAQTVETYRAVHDKLKDHPLIQWKESVKEALGLELAQGQEEWE